MENGDALRVKKKLQTEYANYAVRMMRSLEALPDDDDWSPAKVAYVIGGMAFEAGYKCALRAVLRDIGPNELDAQRGRCVVPTETGQPEKQS